VYPDKHICAREVGALEHCDSQPSGDMSRSCLQKINAPLCALRTFGLSDPCVVAFQAPDRVYFEALGRYEGIRNWKFFSLCISTSELEICLLLTHIRKGAVARFHYRDLGKFHAHPVIFIAETLDYAIARNDRNQSKRILDTISSRSVRQCQAPPAVEPRSSLQDTVPDSVRPSQIHDAPHQCGNLEQSQTASFTDLPLEIQRIVYDHLLRDAVFVFDYRVLTNVSGVDVVHMYLEDPVLKTLRSPALVNRAVHRRLRRQVTLRLQMAVPVFLPPRKLQSLHEDVWTHLSRFEEVKIIPACHDWWPPSLEGLGTYSTASEAGKQQF